MGDLTYYDDTALIGENKKPSDREVPLRILELVRECSLFKSAPQSFVLALTTKLKPLMISAQEFITIEGEEAKAMYWLVKGSVGITSRDGESLYAELSPGAYFGEIGVLFDRPRTATVVARSKCFLLSLSSEHLRVVLPDYPTIDKEIRIKAHQRLTELAKMKDSMNASLKQSKHSNSKSIRDSNESSDYSSLNNHNQISDNTSQDHNDSTLATINSNNTLDLIESIPLLSLLPTTERLSLARKIEPKRYSRFEYVFRQGDREKSVFFITDGLVEVINEHSDNVTAILSKGSMFGEFTFLGLSPHRTASIRTATTIECLEIQPEILASLCRKYVDLQTQVEEMATSRQTRNHVHGFPTDVDPYNPQTYEQQIVPSSSSATSTSSAVPTGAPTTTTVLVPTATSTSKLTSTEEEYSNTWDVKGGRPISPGPRGIKRPATPLEWNSYYFPSATLNNPSSTVSQIQSHDQVQQAQDQNLPDQPPSTSSSPSTLIMHPRPKRHYIKSRRRTSLFNVGPFPDIIQISVFQYMDLCTLMKMRQVCTHWQDLLTKSTSLMTNLNLNEYNTLINDKTIVPIVNFAGARPKHVNISNCFHLTDEGFSYLVNGLGLAGIKTFEMKSVWNVSDNAIMDLTVPSIGMDLEEIDLSNCRQVNDSTVARLIGWVAPAGAVVGCPKLKKLTLSYCKHITDRSMYHMATYAADRISHLDLTRCTGITDHGFAYWSQTMRPFSALRTLNLTDCTFLTDKAIISLAGVAKDLQDLNLTFCCALTDVSVQVLSLGCTKLKRLNMAYCGSAVSDRSLNMVALHLHQLNFISVRGCIRVTRSGIDSIQMGCSKLQSIDASQCRNII